MSKKLYNKISESILKEILLLVGKENVLIDKERRIRGFYDGTEEEDINKIIKDITILKREYN